MNNSVGLSDIRAGVKSLAQDGRARNALISATRGPDRHAARLAKKGIGESARVLLLAYAMLRGVPYDRLERTTRTPPWKLGRILDEVSGIVAEHRPETTGVAVTDWFRGKPVTS